MDDTSFYLGNVSDICGVNQFVVSEGIYDV